MSVVSFALAVVFIIMA